MTETKNLLNIHRWDYIWKKHFNPEITCYRFFLLLIRNIHSTLRGPLITHTHATHNTHTTHTHTHATHNTHNTHNTHTHTQHNTHATHATQHTCAQVMSTYIGPITFNYMLSYISVST